jgi:hypothetical protein
MISTTISTEDIATRTAVMPSTSGCPISSSTTAILAMAPGQPPTGPTESQELSVGLKIGIAVGIIMDFLLLILVFWRMVAQKRKNVEG